MQRASLLLAVIAIGAALDGGCAPSIQGKSPGLAQQSRPLSTAPRFPSAADPNYATTYDKYRQDYHKSNVVAPALGYDDPGLTGKVQPTGAVAAASGPVGSITAGVKKGFARVSKALSPGVPTVEAPDATALSSKAKPSPDLFVATARLSEQSGNFADAERYYRRALSLDPKHLGAMLGCARLMDRQGQLAEATALYQQAAQEHPKEPSVFNDLGLCFARRNMLPQSLASLERAVQLDAKSPLFRHNIATVLVEMGDLPQALSHLRAVHNDAVAYYNLGYLLQKKGRSAEAADCFAKALQRDPSMEQARAWLNALGEARVARSPQPAPAAAVAPTPAPTASQIGRHVADPSQQPPAADPAAPGTPGYAEAVPPGESEVRQLPPVPDHLLYAAPQVEPQASVGPSPGGPPTPALPDAPPRPAAPDPDAAGPMEPAPTPDSLELSNPRPGASMSPLPSGQPQRGAAPAAQRGPGARVVHPLPPVDAAPDEP